MEGPFPSSHVLWSPGARSGRGRRGTGRQPPVAALPLLKSKEVSSFDFGCWQQGPLFCAFLSLWPCAVQGTASLWCHPSDYSD